MHRLATCAMVHLQRTNPIWVCCRYIMAKVQTFIEKRQAQKFLQNMEKQNGGEKGGDAIPAGKVEYEQAEREAKRAEYGIRQEYLDFAEMIQQAWPTPLPRTRAPPKRRHPTMPRRAVAP